MIFLLYSPVILPCSRSRLGVDAVTCQRDWAQSDHDLYLDLAEKAIERGVMPDHDAREPWFLCY